MALVPLVLATDYPGDNLGEKINNADADLGGAPGIIVCPPGSDGANMARVVLSTDRTLMLGVGTYEPDPTSPLKGLFIYNFRNTIIGQGWATVIKERNRVGQLAKSVFADWGQIFGPEIAPGDNNGVDDVRLADFQILGNSPDFDSAVPTLGVGNCNRVTVERVYMNATCSIGINFGGSSGAGYHSSDLWLRDCLLVHVASQPIGFVNCRDFHCIGNTSKAAGQPGGPGASAHIDCEPNAPTDWMDTFEITANNIYGPPDGNEGNGIIVQLGGATFGQVGYGTITGNMIFGSIFGPFGTVDDSLSNGIFLNGCTGVQATGNKMLSCKQNGIFVGNSERCSFTANHLEQCGGGGIASVEFANCTNCSFRQNEIVFYEGSQAGSCGNWIIESGTSDNNRFLGNEIGKFFSTIYGAVILVGPNSVEDGNTYNGIKAKTFPRDGAIEDNVLVKLSDSVAGAAKQLATTDTAIDVLGVNLGTFTADAINYYSIVVTDPTTKVKVKSDGSSMIGLAASVEPSGTSAGRVKPVTGTRCAVNAGASVAATPDLLVDVYLRLAV